MSYFSEEFVFTWKIENFSMLPLRREGNLKSAVFVVQSLIHSEWCLKLYPKGEKDKDFLSCYLCNHSLNPTPIKIGFSIRLESTDPIFEKCKTIKSHTFSEIGHDFGVPELLPLSTLYKNKHIYLPQDVLTLVCCIWPLDNLYVTPTNNYKRTMVPNSFNEYCSSVTQIKVEKKSFTWPITNICKLNGTTSMHLTSSLKDSPSLVLSLSFNNESGERCFEDSMQWSCASDLDEESDGESDEYTDVSDEVSSQDEDAVDKEHVQVNIRQKHLPINKEHLFVRCQITVLSGDKQYQDSKEDTYFFGSNIDEIWSFPAFIKTKNLVNNKYIYISDTLLLQCNFAFSRKGTHYNVEVPEYVPWNFHKIKASKTNELNSSINDLYLNENLSDVSIRAGSKLFPAHKIVLCARSSVLSTMFEVDMKEKNTNVVDINDVEPDTMARFLKFLYSDTIDGDMTVEDTCKLYSAAHKYQVILLKQQCSILLLSKMCMESVCDVLVLADAYNDPFLLAVVHNFLRSHSTESFHSVEWKSYKERYPKLFGDTMIKILMAE